MADKTLREDFNDLKVTVTAALSVQNSWNEQHDARGQEVVKSIDKKIDRLFVLHDRTIRSLDCQKHKALIESNTTLIRLKVDSVEKRLGWLWLAVGVSVFLALVKVIFTLSDKF